MSHFSPLLWLCAVSAAALNSFTALDPTGAYEQYLDALGENTPAIAAFFDAAESGVFPRSRGSRRCASRRGRARRQNSSRPPW